MTMKKKLIYIAPETEVLRLYNGESMIATSWGEAEEGSGDNSDASRENNNVWFDASKQEGEFDKEW